MFAVADDLKVSPIGFRKREDGIQVRTMNDLAQKNVIAVNKTTEVMMAAALT